MLINISSSNLATTTYNLTASPVNGQPLSFFWEVCEVDAAGNCLAPTQVVNPSQWFVGGANTFPGYHGVNTLLPISSGPGVFAVGKKYQIRYGVFGFCTTFTSSSWYLGYTLSSRKLIVASSFRDSIFSEPAGDGRLATAGTSHHSRPRAPRGATNHEHILRPSGRERGEV